MNYEDTPPDCSHPGFFFLNVNEETVLVCWQCQGSFVSLF